MLLVCVRTISGFLLQFHHEKPENTLSTAALKVFTRVLVLEILFPEAAHDFSSLYETDISKGHDGNREVIFIATSHKKRPLVFQRGSEEVNYERKCHCQVDGGLALR